VAVVQELVTQMTHVTNVNLYHSFNVYSQG
jgi:hypothetical protein